MRSMRPAEHASLSEFLGALLDSPNTSSGESQTQHTRWRRLFHTLGAIATIAMDFAKHVML